MNKKAFLDMDVLTSTSFIILLGFAWIATIGGWMMGRSMGMDSFPLYQILIFMGIEIIIVYVITLRGE